MLTLNFILSFLFVVFLVGYLIADQSRLRLKTALGAIFCIVFVSAFSLFNWNGETKRFSTNIKYGLDIKGGTQFTVQLQGNPTASERDKAVEVIRKRVDGMGLAEPLIQPSGSNRIIVQIPGVSERDKEIYRNQLQRVAKLEFRMVHPESDKLLRDMSEGTGTIPFDQEVLPMIARHQKDGKPQEIVVRKRASLGGKYVQTAFRSLDQVGLPVVIVRFNSEGEKLFGNLTEQNIGQRLAIVLDDEVYSAPVIRSAIYGNCEISGSMTPLEAEELASVLQNPLETPVKILDERGVDPSLGQASVRDGFYAAMLGLLAVIVFTMGYYRLVGVIAVGALVLNMIVLLGLLAQFGFTLTMPGVAGIILTFGMAVDANVLIYERIREELKQGKDLFVSVSAGFERAFSSILDANVTTLLAAFVLFWQGSGPIQGFAITLCIGVLTSMFAALVGTRASLEGMVNSGWVKSIKMSSFISDNPKINFMGLRRLALSISLALVVASMVLAWNKGDRALGVDFVGGDLITLEVSEKISDAQIQTVVPNMNITVQYSRATGGDDEILSIRTPFGQAENVEKILVQNYPDIKIHRLSLDKVEGVIGAELKQKALIAFLLSMLGIFFYVMWRFEGAYAVGAIIALFHDIILSLGVFMLMGRELSLPVVGALLTVAGYSINDTIIIFDRIRENLKNGAKGSLAEIMNQAINQTLSRTMITSGTTLIAVLCMYLFGGVVINDFALILLVGIVIGTYSSIYIASPIALMLSGKAGSSKLYRASST